MLASIFKRLSRLCCCSRQAVVVFDRFDVSPFAAERDVLGAAAADLLYHMERFPGMVVLLVSAEVHFR